MERSEIAEIFCVAISSGNIPVLLESFVFEQTTWTVVSETGPSDSERRFLGISGAARRFSPRQGTQRRYLCRRALHL
jgi:hypothetical protein